MSYIQEIIRLAANTEYQKEAIDIATASMKIIDKLKEREDKSHLTTAVILITSGILKPLLGNIVSKTDKHCSILTYELGLNDYDADTPEGWCIATDSMQTDVPGLSGRIEGQTTTENERQKFKVELPKKLNSILATVTVLDVSMIPSYWIDGELDTDTRRITVSPALNFTDDIDVSKNNATGDIRIVDNEHIQ